MITSMPHTLFLTGEYASAIESYSGRAALGDRQQASMLLRERLARMQLSEPMAGLMSSLLALLEDRADEVVRLMKATETTRDPEILVYLTRQTLRWGWGMRRLTR